jgi:hypothetical protein
LECSGEPLEKLLLDDADAKWADEEVRGMVPEIQAFSVA